MAGVPEHWAQQLNVVNRPPQAITSYALDPTAIRLCDLSPLRVVLSIETRTNFTKLPVFGYRLPWRLSDLPYVGNAGRS